MKYAYSRAVYPPGMIIPISLSSIDQDKSIKLRAEIDTGAGITSIPETAAQDLKLTPFNTVEARGAFDEYKIMYTYFVVIKFEDGRTFEVETVLNKKGTILLGRDILNQLKIIADGPNAILEIK